MLLHTKSTPKKKKNYSKKYLLPKKNTQVIYSSKSISLLYTTGNRCKEYSLSKTEVTGMQKFYTVHIAGGANVDFIVPLSTG